MRSGWIVVLAVAFCALAQPAAACTPEPRSQWREVWGVSTCAWLEANGGAVRGTLRISQPWPNWLASRLGSRTPVFVRSRLGRKSRFDVHVVERWGPAVPRRIEVRPPDTGCLPELFVQPSEEEYVLFGRFDREREVFVLVPENHVLGAEIPTVLEALGRGARPALVPAPLRQAVGRLGVLSLLSVFCWWWFALGVRSRVRGVRGH